GTRMLLEVVAQQLDGRADDVRGTILDGVQVGRLQLVLPGTAVDVTDLRLDVGWRALGQRLLQVQELSAQQVQVALTTTPDAPQPPADETPFTMPTLPVKVAVERFAVGSLAVTMDGEPLPVSVRDIDLGLWADEQTARLDLNSLHVAHEQALADLKG